MADARREALADFEALCVGLAPMPDAASHVHALLMDAMVAAGYRVFQEYTVELGNGQGGRIDVVAQAKNGQWLAIEIDARRPRQRSIKKLVAKDWLRISCLRGVSDSTESYPELDAIIALPIRAASAEEREHKARIRRAVRGLPR